MSNKVLVTGADGFIGSHLSEALVLAGFHVKAFVLYNSFNTWGWLDHCAPRIKSELDVFSGDIRDGNGVRQAMKGCDIVLHLASLISIPYSYHSPETYIETNVKGTLNVLQAAQDLNISRIVHTSTSEVYGTARFVPITEQHPLQGQSPYSASKIGADQLALSFHSSFGLPLTIARPFNTYGPRQSARAIIPSVILQLIKYKGSKPVQLGALEPTRDFNFVSDTVNGFISLMTADNVFGEVFNFGSNYEISIGETAQMIAEVMEVPLRIESDVARLRPAKSEVERLRADNQKACTRLNWRPQYGGRDGLRRGLRETVIWFSEQANNRCYKPDIYNI